MRDQDALGALRSDLDMGLDQVVAAAHVGCDVGRHMAHAGVKHEARARAVEACGVLGETRAEAVIERQHLMRLRLLPPQLDQRREPLRLGGGEIMRLGEILGEMKQLPFVAVERRARGMKGDRLPAVVPEAAMPEHLEILRHRLRWRRRIRDRRREADALQRHLRHACDRGRRRDADQVEQGRHQVAGMDELMAQFALRGDALRP